jgi:hypothetical protein
MKLTDWIFDIETYKELFSFCIVRADGKFKNTFEVSAFQNQTDRILNCLDYLHENNFRMVGFNNKGFDYPILHKLIQHRDSLPKSGKATANKVFTWAQQQIESFKDDGFGNVIKTDEEYVKQVDLYRIHHFNNKAKATSLKMLEFNMREDNIKDLPFDIRQELTQEHVKEILVYNEHDVDCTLDFYNASQSQISFRDDLSAKLGKDFTNADDTKIGSEYFQMELEKNGVKLFKYTNGKRTMKQTHRSIIDLFECLFDYYNFTRPEFIAVQKWFRRQHLTETKGVFSDIEEHKLGDVAKFSEMTIKRKRFKGVPTEQEIALFKKEHPMGWVDIQELSTTEYLFDAEGDHVMEYPKDENGDIDFTKKQKKVRVPKKSYWGCYNVAETLNVVVEGFRFDFGVGGIHGSISDKVVNENKDWAIYDHDVTSFYPNLAISNRIYPEHLGETFCDIYKDMFEQRKSFDKKSAENAMLKLALNGTYGKSNDKFSVFYDPKFTMSITVNGQLTLCMLVDMFYSNGVQFKIVQINTDGVTVAVKRSDIDLMNSVMKEWESAVKLQLESVEYSKMLIRDVNNYISVYTDGKTKRKGAYQYEGLGWHQNQSGLVIPMAAESHMIKGTPVLEFLKNHLEQGNVFDFMLRTKVDRSSRLVLNLEDGTETEQQRICRYYPCKEGGKLVKIMKPLEGSDEYRRIGIDTQWKVKTCNSMKDFNNDVDFDYYVSEVEKLLIVANKPQSK